MPRLKTAMQMAAAFLAGSASAQQIGGDYAVQGTNFNGSPYSGQARITIKTDTTCEIEWTTGTTTSTGFCMRNGDAFAAGYAMGKDVGLVIYRMMPDGSLNGLWTINGQNGSGTDVLIPK